MEPRPALSSVWDHFRSPSRQSNLARLLKPRRGMPAGDTAQQGLLDAEDSHASTQGRLDRMTRLVADVLGAPIAMISRTESGRQRVAACIGLDCASVERDARLCAHAVSHRLLEVPDARADRRFRDHPAVTGEAGIRFFAGADLRQPGGGPLGTLCVMGKEPRRLTETECRLMLRLADVVEQELTLQSQLGGGRREPARTELIDEDTGLPTAPALEATAESLLSRSMEAGLGVAAVAIRPATLHDAEWVRSAESGPELMRSIAGRIDRHVPEDTELARLDGPWFMALLRVDAGIGDFMASVRTLAEQLARPHDLETGRVRIPCTVGVATVFPGDGIEAGELFSRARRTAEHLSLARDGSVGLYSEQLDQRVLRRQRIAARLPGALADEVLSLRYQPIVSLDDGRLVGVEALLRWDDEQLGPVGAEEILAVAGEDPQLSRSLTRFILRTALSEGKAWSAAGVQLHVNINALELVNSDITALIEDLLEETGFDAGALTLELTEESLVPDMEEAAETFATLALQGVGMAIDDFGTGYSSLRYLQRLPARALKIDRSFIADMAENPYSFHLVRGIVDVAAKLDIQVIAEGVENAAQQRQLMELGCAAGQGYFLYAPQEARTVTRMVERQASRSVDTRRA